MAVSTRSWTLRLAGAIFIATGGLCGLVMAVTGFTGGNGQAPGLSGKSIVWVLIFYALMATAFLILGFGLLALKRWARNLAIQLSALWFFAGIIALGVSFFTLPTALAAAGLGENLKGAFVAAIIFITLIYVILPLGLLLLLRGEAEEAAIEEADPVPDWTSLCPPKALALSLSLWICALATFPGLWASNFFLPFFGFSVSGVFGALVCLALAVLTGFVARAAYKLENWSWWLGLFYWPFWSVSGYLTVSKLGWDAYASITGNPALSASKATLENLPWIAIFLISNIVIAATMFWIKTDFAETKISGPAEEPPARARKTAPRHRARVPKRARKAGR
jgi:hypothetical protein